MPNTEQVFKGFNDGIQKETERTKMEIFIDWAGPYRMTDLEKLKDENYDYGIYQIYGHHFLYGSNVLLYIGKSSEQTFGKRIQQERWHELEDSNNIQIYVGRLIGKTKPSNEKWAKMIDLSERLLIFSHCPAYNSAGLNSIPEQDLLDIHVISQGNYRSLLLEVSGAAYTSKHEKEYSGKSFRYDN